MCCFARFDALFAGAALLFAVCVARADGIVAESAQLVTDGGGYSLDADFEVSLSQPLESAVNKGLVLYFTADFELTHSRWYWFDQTVVRRGKTFRLSYHALTRRYRLSSGALHQSFHALNDALRVLSRVRRWRVIEKGDIDSEVDYMASARLRLDPSQMAKTFQVSALSNRDFRLSSGWLVWNFSSSEAALTGDAASGTEDAR
jgi:hypothetical protein